MRIVIGGDRRLTVVCAAYEIARYVADRLVRVTPTDCDHIVTFVTIL
ncbi:MAG: hypothetical protein ACRDRI_15995 [Pseudonocardiaceae bacterium]